MTHSPVGALDVGSDHPGLDAPAGLSVGVPAPVLPAHPPLVVGAERVGSHTCEPQRPRLGGHGLTRLPVALLHQLLDGVGATGDDQVAPQDIQRLKNGNGEMSLIHLVPNLDRSLAIGQSN